MENLCDAQFNLSKQLLYMHPWTPAVFLTREDGNNCGGIRPYKACGIKNSWRSPWRLLAKILSTKITPWLPRAIAVYTHIRLARGCHHKSDVCIQPALHKATSVTQAMSVAALARTQRGQQCSREGRLQRRGGGGCCVACLKTNCPLARASCVCSTYTRAREGELQPLICMSKHSFALFAFLTIGGVVRWGRNYCTKMRALVAQILISWTQPLGRGWKRQFCCLRVRECANISCGEGELISNNGEVQIKSH